MRRAATTARCRRSASTPRGCARNSCRPTQGPHSITDGAFHHALEALIFGAGRSAADQADLLEEVLGLEHIALLDVPHAVIVQTAHVSGIGSERPLAPRLGRLLVAG